MIAFLFNLIAVSLAFSQAPTHQISPPTLSAISCLTTHNIPFSSPHTNNTTTSPLPPSLANNWTFLSTPYNLRIPWTPAIIAIPETGDQVSEAVRCGSESGLKVQARSGGHSYAGFGLGGRDGSLIIDLRAWNEIVLDENNIARVGAGVRLGNLALTLHQNHRALPHGVCPGVGMGGHFTHGGYGYPSRLWGLALDSIVALDAVLANGSQIHITATLHPNLFYALRGAADSFAIVTTFYLQTHPAPVSIVVFTARIPAAVRDPGRAAKAMVKLQELVIQEDFMGPELSMSFYLNEKGAFTLRGWCIECSVKDFEGRVWGRLLGVFPEPEGTSVVEMDWIEGLNRLSDGIPLDLPLYSYDDHDTFYSKSLLTSASNPLTYDQWLSFFTFIHAHGHTAPSPWNTIIDLYGGHGSRINNPPSYPLPNHPPRSPSLSAFSHRNTLWVIQNNANTASHLPPFLKTIITFVEDLTNAMPPREEGGEEFGVYLNCADDGVSDEEWARRGYGKETWEKLVRIKKDVDPEDVFWNPHSVRKVDFREKERERVREDL